MSAIGTAQAAALIINVVADIYFRARQEGVKITPENIRQKLEELEAKITAQEKRLGIDS